MSALLDATGYTYKEVRGDSAHGLNTLFSIRKSLIVDHPLNRAVIGDHHKLFQMFELYAAFVYDFTEYVAKLFISLNDADMKEVIYENLVDELGIGAGKPEGWKTQHGELYREFIATLRENAQYKANGSALHTQGLESTSRAISKRFYSTHAQIIDERDDLQSFAAFSTIECWVCDLYAFWKKSLTDLVRDHSQINLRTIDLHCVCDAEHSAALDQLLSNKLKQEDTAQHRASTGVIRGMVASERLFTDIYKALA